MSIASRIDSIEQHLKESYQELKGLGIDTTGVNNNLENIPKLIDGYWQTLPKVTGEGTSITLDNTKEGKMGIIYKGNTYQYSTTGVNLFTGKSSYSKTIHNVEFTINDSKVTINGQNDYSGQINSTEKDFITPYQVEPNTVYTYKVFVLSGSFTGTRFAMNLRSGSTGTSTSVQFNVGSSLELASGTNSATFTSSSNSNYLTGLQFIFSADAKFTNLVLGVELVKGNTEPTTYEPYTNGASPNPDYPQEIHVVSGDNTIKVEGKNLFDLSTLFKNKFGGNTTSDKGITFTNNNGTINLNGTSTGTAECIIGVWNGPTPLIELDSSQTYTLKIFGKEKSGNTVVCGVDIRGIKNGSASKIIYGSNNTDTIELTGWSSIVYIDIYTQYTSGAINKNISIQLVKGSTIPTTYTPYVSQTYPISLGNIELCKIGTYQDKIFKNTPNTTDYNSELEDNVWYLNKQIGKVVFDGSENWGSFQIESSGLGRAIVGGNNIFYNSGEATILCNKLKGVKYGTSWTNTFDCIASFSSNRFIAYLIGVTDLTTFKNKLASGFNVYYVLATPTYTEITDSTLLGQLETIKTSYENQTNISQENNDLASVLNASALRGETETPNLQRLALEPNDELRDEEPIEEEVIEEEPTEEIENDDMR